MADRRREVRATYDRIAEHFAATREYAWPEVETFVAEAATALEAGRAETVGLDVGCGNGRHAELLAGVVDRVVGLDLSRGLLETARDRATDRDVPLELCQGDASRLALATDAVDVAIYVATLHHLPTRELRVASLAELERALAPGGRALVSAWSTAHDRFADRRSESDGAYPDGFDTTVAWTLPGGEPVERFYHIYAPAAFEADLAASPLSVVSVELSSGNCYAVVESG